MSTATISADTDRSGLLRPLGLVAGISLVANLIVYAVARLADVDFAITAPGQSEETVNGVAVGVMSVATVVVGGIALLVARRWAPRAWQVLAWVGLVVGIVTIPAFADAEAGTKVALGAMHVIVGGVWFWFVSRLAK
jgi:hypothetical protein